MNNIMSKLGRMLTIRTDNVNSYVFVYTIKDAQFWYKYQVLFYKKRLYTNLHFTFNINLLLKNYLFQKQ